MIAYVDSSVILRLILGQADSLREWKSVERGVASALVEVECLRTVDRLRFSEPLDENEVVELRQAVFHLVASLEVVDTSRAVLSRAAQPMPTALGTLDAIHLSTALLWRDSFETDLTMATHDRALTQGARSVGLDVIGA